MQKMKLDKEERYPVFEEIENFLQDLSRKEPERVTLDVEGRSPQNRSVYSVTLTNPGAAEEKQNVVLSCVHSTERSAVAVLFAVMDWLLSSDPLACEVMRRQQIVCMPIVNPDGYVESNLDPDQRSRNAILYSGWDMTGVLHPDCAPEATALQRIIDRYQPDLYADVHGVSLDFESQLMLESSASSPTRTTNRPYHQQIARLMDQAALKEGFPSDFQEDDREVLCWDPSVDPLKAKLWTGRGCWSPGLYAYSRYHTLHVLMEITWQRSGLLRFQRLLRIGNEQWEGEPCRGYPNHVVAAFGPSGMYQMIAAYGQDGARQRESRVEMWRKHHQFASAIVDPQMTGKTAAVFTLSADARREWLEAKDTLADFAANLKRHPAVNAEYIQDFLSGWPCGQNRPEAALSVWHGGQGGECPGEDEPIRHGAALRVRVPYPKASIRDIRLNGHPLAESSEDGYSIWKARGFTFIQANVPPAKSQVETLWILTCKYDPGEHRPHWEFWAGKRAKQALEATFAKE